MFFQPSLGTAIGAAQRHCAAAARFLKDINEEYAKDNPKLDKAKEKFLSSIEEEWNQSQEVIAGLNRIIENLRQSIKQKDDRIDSLTAKLADEQALNRKQKQVNQTIQDKDQQICMLTTRLEYEKSLFSKQEQQMKELQAQLKECNKTVKTESQACAETAELFVKAKELFVKAEELYAKAKEERAETKKQCAEAEEQRAEAEKQRAEVEIQYAELAFKFKELGEQVGEATGNTWAQNRKLEIIHKLCGELAEANVLQELKLDELRRKCNSAVSERGK